jgi:hypothetical protein
LPYNPNRLEQRNGRIDRYGQRNDPEIRYLFLAGTFEERLLLHLIAKYEKARACLSFMPNTLGVGADPASLREPLCAGRADDLFSAMPRLIHSLDLAAEDTDSAAYHDLLREIDRAFQSFDHMAVRHGWLSGAEELAPPPAETPPNIDLVAFVRSVLTAEPDGYCVPPAWRQDLDGLPGFDAASGPVRLTDNAEQVRDSCGRPLLYPGRAHALTRRAIASVRTGRVSATQGRKLSLLMTYMVEAGSLLRSVFALLLGPDGSVSEQADFLSIANDPVPPNGLWQSMFAPWAPQAIVAAGLRAAAVSDRIGAAGVAAYQNRLDRDAATVRAWLVGRANELCGPLRSLTRDLFASDPTESDWRCDAAPEQRLSGFAVDPSVSAPQRREAAEALARSSARPPPFPRYTVRHLGMLMLVP